MARILEEQIKRLKAEVSLERLAEARGVALKRHGADVIGLCPFHDDHEPSLVISPKSNLWHYQPFAAGSSAGPVKRASTPKVDNPLPRDAEDQQLLNRVIEFYHETLKQSPEALAYLDKRGIACPRLIEHFKLWVANRTLGYRLPAKNRTERAALRAQLQRIGILRASGHEHFNGSLVNTVMDAGGNVAEAYGRKLNDNLRKDTPKHLYLPGPLAEGTGVRSCMLRMLRKMQDLTPRDPPSPRPPATATTRATTWPASPTPTATPPVTNTTALG